MRNVKIEFLCLCRISSVRLNLRCSLGVLSRNRVVCWSLQIEVYTVNKKKAPALKLRVNRSLPFKKISATFDLCTCHEKVIFAFNINIDTLHVLTIIHY